MQNQKYKIMKKISFLIASILILTISCKDANKNTETTTADENLDEIIQDQEQVVEEKTEQTNEKASELKITLESKSGNTAKGDVVFTENNGTVEMTATLTGLSEGEHAIHLHEKADCSADDATSAGGHWNPTFEPHGKWGAEEGYHKGDIGNFTADAEGNGTVQFSTDEWCIGCDDEKKNIIGKSVVVHQGTDDFTSQPSGDAGARISCGGVIQ